MTIPSQNLETPLQPSEPAAAPVPAAFRSLKALRTRMVLEGTSQEAARSDDPWLQEAVLANGARAWVFSNSLCAVLVVGWTGKHLAALTPFGRVHVQGETELVVLVPHKALHEATQSIKNLQRRK